MDGMSRSFIKCPDREVMKVCNESCISSYHAEAILGTTLGTLRYVATSKNRLWVKYINVSRPPIDTTFSTGLRWTRTIHVTPGV